MTVTTRVVFAMTRDGALPGSKYIAGVSGKSQLPLKSIFFVFVIDSIIVLLPLISDTAFSAITQISTIGYSTSYAIPIILRVTVSRNTFQQGPYNLGRLSILNGVIASVFLVCTSICFFFPTSFDENMQQTAEDFNYTCVVYGAALVVAGIYWFGGARKWFTGPVRPEDILPGETEQEYLEKKIVKGDRAVSVFHDTQSSPDKVDKANGKLLFLPFLTFHYVASAILDMSSSQLSKFKGDAYDSAAKCATVRIAAE
jgi:hypothetical protein